MTRTVWIATWIVQIARIVSGIVIRIVRIVIFMFMIVAMMIRNLKFTDRQAHSQTDT